MNITSIETFPYTLSMKQNFVTSKNTFSTRKGYIIKIKSNKFVGYGDVCPLPNFNCEKIKDTLYGIEQLKSALLGYNAIDENEIFDMMEVYLSELPSGQFGFNTALIDLKSKIAGLPFAKYLNKYHNKKIYSNGLESLHSPNDKFKIIKVKVGYKNLFDELEHLEQLKNKFGGNIKFRLDANGCFDLPKAIRFCKEVEKYNIDYIEQPLSKHSYDDLYELSLHTKLNIALDESVTDINSIKKIIETNSANILIIKPMVVGSFKKIKDLINLANNNNLEIIITSSLESNVGLTASIHLASAFNINNHCGFSTSNIFEKNFKSPINIINGEIQIPDNPGLGISLINVN